MMWGYYGNSFGWGIIGWLMMIVMMALPVALIVWVIYKISNSGSQNGKSVLDVLKERYAKGEIDRKEFEEKKKDIEK
jgi:putative membrane protein